MTISSVSDVLAAYEAGRVHTQRFYKGSLVNIADGQWQDWAFAPGQPAYDARIGVAGRFNPYIATRNDAIWFPGIEPGQTRHLAEVTLRLEVSGTGNNVADAVIYDLVGVYPLVDGDSTDFQILENDELLPRYADGVGVFPVLVNHVAPMLVGAAGVFTYLDHAGVTRSTPFRASLAGPGRVCSGPDNGIAVGASALSLPLGGGSRGVKAVTGIQFTTTPGGLFSIYMYRPLTTIINSSIGSSAGVGKVATVKPSLGLNAWHMPRIHDGAHLGMFLRLANGGRAVSQVFGNMEFVWG